MQVCQHQLSFLLTLVQQETLLTLVVWMLTKVDCWGWVWLSTVGVGVVVAYSAPGQK